jgi:hypothetical protein
MPEHDIRRSFPAGNCANVKVKGDLEIVILIAGFNEANMWVSVRR